MSYTADIESAIAEVTSTAENQPTLRKQALVSHEMVENPSATELFSYAVCCAGQGLVWAMYLVLFVTVPAAISQGMFLNWR